MSPVVKKRILLALESLGKVLLVAALVYSIGWTLVKVSEWKTRQPAIAANPDGSLSLVAETATINGPGGARVNDYAGKRNIGWWNKTEQTLTWITDIPSAGNYEVTLDYSLPDGHETTIELTVSDKSLSSTLTPTGGWDRWTSKGLGMLRIGEGNRQTITLRATHLKKAGVMNFVSLSLVPKGD